MWEKRVRARDRESAACMRGGEPSDHPCGRLNKNRCRHCAGRTCTHCGFSALFAEGTDLVATPPNMRDWVGSKFESWSESFPHPHIYVVKGPCGTPHIKLAKGAPTRLALPAIFV